MKILKTNQQMYFHWSLPVFTVVMVCERNIIMTITQDKIMRIMNFILKLNS